jgi:hypothetical protein
MNPTFTATDARDVAMLPPVMRYIMALSFSGNVSGDFNFATASERDEATAYLRERGFSVDYSNTDPFKIYIEF